MIKFKNLVKNYIMDLRCRKTQCLYNYKYTCTAKNIKISKKLLCATYIKANKEAPDTSRFIFDRAPDYAPQRESKTADILCEADCLFNQCKCCEANGITVNPINEKPHCITFLKDDNKKTKKI